ncbi:MAG: DUF2341 domain-containing protein [Kiritimatiellae bacterium]|nr:DUF2341 domain-containing protein [Kiritimatiellia bacterium]
MHKCGLALMGLVLWSAMAVHAEALNPALFTKKCSFLVSGYTGTETLTDFPVLVRLSPASVHGFAYADCLFDGADLRFTDAAGELIPHEIDTWNTAGESLIWVKVPVLTGTTTSIRLYYGTTSLASLPQVDAASVWPGYALVVHGGAAGGVIHDSSPNPLSVTVGGSTTATDDGRIGIGNVSPAPTEKVKNGLHTLSPLEKLTNESVFTVSGWLTQEKTGTAILFGSMSAWDNPGLLVLNEQGTELSFTSRGAEGNGSGHKKTAFTWAMGSWMHVCVVYNNTTGTSYYNGAALLSAEIPASQAPAGQMWGFGNYGGFSDHSDCLTGKMDEWRIFNGAASADWIKAEYDSVNNPAFLTAGEVSGANQSNPTVIQMRDFTLEGETATVNGLLMALGDDLAGVGVVLRWGEALENLMTVATLTSPGTFSATIPVTAGKRYYAVFTARSGGAEVATSETVTIDVGLTALWRPQNADDTWDTPAWIMASGPYSGVRGLFVPYWQVGFDGQESPYLEEVKVPSDVIVSGLSISGDRSYRFTGKTVDAGEITKSGRGSLAIDGTGLVSTNFTVTGGTVTLGADLEGAGLGGEGRITVKNATFDVNYPESNDSDLRKLMTQQKRFFIEGDGVDGQGALVNNGYSSTAHLVHDLVLTGNASVGGQSNFYMGNVTGSSVTGDPTITGNPGAVLTVKGGARFTMISTDLQIGRVDIDGTTLGMESAMKYGEQFGGFTLRNGGAFRFWDVSTPISVPVSVTEGVGTIASGHGFAAITGPVTSAAGTTLMLDSPENVGVSGVYYQGGIQAEGTLTVKRGYHFLASEVNKETLTVSGADGDANAPRNVLLFGDRTTASGMEFTLPAVVTEAGGMLALAPHTDTTYRNIRVSGEGAFNPSSTGTGTAVSRIEDTEIDLPSLRMGTGTPNSRGQAVLGNNTKITVENLFLGDIQASPASATLTLEEGSVVNVTGSLLLGRWSGDSTSLHKLVVDGGTLNAPDVAIEAAHDSPNDELWLKAGEMTVKGIKVRPGLGYDSLLKMANSYEIFTMEGGTLNLGSDGISTYRGYPRCPNIWLGGGTLLCGSDWTMEPYRHVMFEPYGTLRNLPGSVPQFTLDLNGHALTFNSVMQGESDVLLTGNGSFIADNDTQGGLSGHWTIANAAGNTLKNVAAFGGGLTLEEGVMATIDIASTDRYVAMTAYAQKDNKSTVPSVDEFGTTSSVTPGWFCHRMNNILTLPSTPHYTAFRFDGEFYVDEGQAGTYTFAVSYDDNLTLWIDGTQVCRNSAWDQLGIGSAELAVGWHPFKLVAVDYGGGAGPAVSDWKNAKVAIGYHFGSTTSPSVNDYRPFDTDAFPMRPAISVRHVRNALGSGKKAEWVDPQYTSTTIASTMTGIHATDWADGNLAANEFSGWFYVEAADAGEWTFNGVYDDHMSVKIDGNEILLNTSWNAAVTETATLDAGWHTFAVRVYDYGGGISNGRGNCLTYTKPGGEATPFDERTIRMSAHPYGIIGGSLELKEGSQLVNTSDSPCEIVGTLEGTGTLDGRFAMRGGTWKLTGTPTGQELAGVTFENAYPETLKGIAKFEVAFSGKPTRNSYLIAPALGLTGEEEGFEEMASATALIDGVATPCEKISLAIKDGNLYLVNSDGAGTVLILH